MSTKICIISDTHGQHYKFNIPKCDIFIHAGDFMNSGKYLDEIFTFNSWLKGVPAEHKLICGGNHDILFETHPDLAKKELSVGTYLQNESITILGIKFYFAPQTPEFYDWAFNVPRGEKIKAYWDAIPEDTEILVTHGPPQGILDEIKPGSGGQQLGCEELIKRVKQLPKLKYHIFGHIHGSSGIAPSIFGPTFMNVSALDEKYRPSTTVIQTISW